MESGKKAETLEEGLLESKFSQEDIFSSEYGSFVGLLSGVNEKCVGDGCGSRNELSNVELARLFGEGVDGVAGYNGMSEESVYGYPDENPLVSLQGNGVQDNDVLVFKEELAISGNDGDRSVKVEEESVGKLGETLYCDEPFHKGEIEAPVETCGDVLLPHDPDSSIKIEAFGHLDGISDDDLDQPGKCKSGESDFKQDFSPDDNGTVSTGVTDLRSKSEGRGGIIGEQERMFDNGDLVWIKTRTQSWWPGMVCCPSTARNDMAKRSCLVKYYGNSSIVWCDIADLRSFVDYFEQISGQNNSRSFLSSVERAICEIGLRVQLKMTCPCFPKDSAVKEENLISTEKASMIDVGSLSQFQPASFVAEIRDLARSMHAPGKIELMVMKNRLSPFYRSMGHFELPLQLLMSDVKDENATDMFGDGRKPVEANDGNITKTRRYVKRKNPDDKLTSSAKGMESRERKKSKFLSYPYVDIIKGQEKEDLVPSSGPEGGCSGMDSRKRGTKKPSKERHIVSKADDISASSAELLAELSALACDCSYISRSKYSDSLNRFYCSFRMFAFLDADIASKAGGDQPALVLEAGEQMEGSKVLKKSKKQKANTASAKESVENVVDGNQKVQDNVVRKRVRKKKVQVANSVEQMEGIRVGKESENQEAILAPSSLENAAKTENLQAKENAVYMETNKEKEKSTPAGLQSVQNPLPIIYPNSSWMINFQQACSSLFKSSKAPQNSIGSIPGLPDTNSIPILPDLNGIHPGFPPDHIPIGVPTSNQVTPVDHIPFGVPTSDHIPFGVPTSNLVTPLPEQKKEGLVSPAINGLHHINLASDSSSKDVAPAFQNTPVSNNGVNSIRQCLVRDFTARAPEPLTMSSFIKHSLQMGSFLSSGKPEPKKRRRKEKASCEVAPSIPDLNGNVLDTSPLGTATPEGCHIPPEGEPQRKRRYKCDSGESDGGSVLLNFAQGSVPPKETLVATFSRFGLLKESELEFLSDDSVKIVYERSSDARFAFRSLEKSCAFGESLLNFSLDSSMPEPPKMKKKQTNPQLQTFVPVAVGASKNRTTKIGAVPDIASIKQNVEMMRSTLEKAGNSLSQEMRAKLENEIKAFLDKISSS
ncbi:serine/threonine-protein kinase ATM [Salvia hispanica]|uniref:serine/threonine-protein kinase ATM n=1 Tax=Salvia hispanica TaxID=49212 RepID=UPI0020098498|nr:serine/threonine-protein kinase ATM [Salvia hispanica]